ncbi:MAG: MerR family transcriptional regulator [Pseudomonadota bacterium]|nr:MAG: MerR family transcriptional regulator [Pseudomonadota bacterium]
MSSRTKASKERTGLYPISTVSELTGINSVTLRAWERRYGLVRPQRTEKGHRLYTAGDVDHIRQILRLVEEGVPISRVREALRLEEQSAAAPAPEDMDAWRSYLERMVEAVSRFDEAGLEATYNDAMSLYPVDVVTRRLLLPLLQTLGTRWLSAEGSIAEEHFFGVYMRNKLGARFHHRGQRNRGPRLIVACMPGEYHEIGLLLFALAAHDRGFRLILLGADLPLDELPLVVERTQADGIVLSSSVKPQPGTLDRDLPALVSAAGVPVFIGGKTADEQRVSIEDAGAIAVGAELALGLRQINDIIQHGRGR